MSATHSRFGLSAVKLRSAAALHRGGDELASAHPDKTCRRHQPSDPLATNANAFGRKIDMNARRAIDAARSRVRDADLRHQRGRRGPARPSGDGIPVGRVPTEREIEQKAAVPTIPRRVKSTPRKLRMLGP